MLGQDRFFNKPQSEGIELCRKHLGRCAMDSPVKIDSGPKILSYRISDRSNPLDDLVHLYR